MIRSEKKEQIATDQGVSNPHNRFIELHQIEIEITKILFVDRRNPFCLFEKITVLVYFVSRIIVTL